MSLNKHYEAVRKAVLNDGFNVSYLENMASTLTRISKEDRAALFAEFHNHAGKFPYKIDSDIGALILEREADLNAHGELKNRLYREASWRARWCAACATAGGEGLSRAVDMKRILAKLKETEPAA